MLANRRDVFVTHHQDPRLPMPTLKPFPQAGFLSYLEHLDASASGHADISLPSPLKNIFSSSGETGELTPAANHLVQLLKARKAMLKASFDTDVVAGELRRYQKFARPGQPSPHIVQLRQQQAAARQASSQSKQSFIKEAAAFVRDAGIEVPQRTSLEVFIIGWIDANVPTMSASSAD
jgi:hypothetical protein